MDGIENGKQHKEIGPMETPDDCRKYTTKIQLEYTGCR